MTTAIGAIEVPDSDYLEHEFQLPEEGWLNCPDAEESIDLLLEARVIAYPTLGFDEVVNLETTDGDAEVEGMISELFGLLQPRKDSWKNRDTKPEIRGAGLADALRGVSNQDIDLEQFVIDLAWNGVLPFPKINEFSERLIALCAEPVAA